MEWNDSYLLGVEEIDLQHQGLFAAANRVLSIIDHMDRERSRRACIEAVKYLKDYAARHFADEEAYQLSIGYSGYFQHRAQHQDFVAAILERERVMEQEDYSFDSVQSFMSFIVNWLVQHIMNADQAFAHWTPPPEKKPPIKASQPAAPVEEAEDKGGGI